MTEKNAPDTPGSTVEWRKPSVYSVIVFIVCIGALAWAVHAKVAGASEGLLAGVGAILLYLTQGPRTVPPKPDTGKDGEKS